MVSTCVKIAIGALSRATATASKIGFFLRFVQKLNACLFSVTRRIFLPGFLEGIASQLWPVLVYLVQQRHHPPPQQQPQVKTLIIITFGWPVANLVITSKFFL